MNRKEKREIIFQQAVERGGTKTPPELRRWKRRRQNAAAKLSRRRNRGSR